MSKHLITTNSFVIPSHLLALCEEPGAYDIEGRMAVLEEGGSLGLYFTATKVTKVSDSPKGPQLNIHDHRAIVKAAGGRHDHPAPPWGANHRHILNIKSRPVPPIVVGCLGVGHSDIDCFAAQVTEVDLCRKCEAALGRPL